MQIGFFCETGQLPEENKSACLLTGIGSGVKNPPDYTEYFHLCSFNLYNKCTVSHHGCHQISSLQAFQQLLQPAQKESSMQHTEYLSFYLLRKANNGKRTFHALLSSWTDGYGPRYTHSDILKIFQRTKRNIMYTQDYFVYSITI